MSYSRTLRRIGDRGAVRLRPEAAVVERLTASQNLSVIVDTSHSSTGSRPAAILVAAPLFLSVFAASGLVSSVSQRAHGLLTELGAISIVLSYTAAILTLPRSTLIRKQAVFALLMVAIILASLLSRTDDYRDFDRRFILTVLVLLPALWATMNSALKMASAGYAVAAGLSLPALVNLVEPRPLVGYVSTNNLAQSIGIDAEYANYAGLSRAFGASCIVLIALALQGPQRFRKVAGTAAIPLGLLCAAGGGRAQLLALIVVTALLIVSFGIGQQLYFAALPFAGALLLVASAIDLSRFRGILRLTSLIEQRSSADRFDLWNEAWQYAASSPKNFFVGGGATGFSVQGVDAAGYTPHNIVLEVAAIWGVPLALAMTVLLGATARRFVRAARLNRPVGETALFAILTFVAVALATSSSLFQSPITFIVIALCFRFVVAQPEPTGNPV